jgi:hypothetical protein
MFKCLSKQPTELACSGLAKPRAVLEVKRPDISSAVYEARLRGYDRARERALGVRKK